jgi:hypothetical protein
MAICGAWSRSSTSEKHLHPFINGKVLPEKSAGKWRIPAGEDQPQPEPGEFVVFLSFLERGLAFPTSEYFC